MSAAKECFRNRPSRKEQLAELLQSVPKEREKTLIAMTHIFIMGMEVQAQISDCGPGLK